MKDSRMERERYKCRLRPLIRLQAAFSSLWCFRYAILSELRLQIGGRCSGICHGGCMSIYDGLNEQQKQGVFETEGPVLLLAGAGSGKTRVLVHRIAYLIEEKEVNPYNILAITFTNKAAAQMRERVDNLVGLEAGSAWIMTFHAACMRILRRYISWLGYSDNFTVYDTEDQRSVVKQAVKKLDLDPKIYKEKAVLAQISRAKDDLITPEEMEKEAVLAPNFQKRNVARVYQEYQSQLKSNNALDFDDIICRTVELFTKYPEILEYYQKRFRYIMVDEYQDTNMAQFRLVSLLAGGHHNLCVVGDDDQSIYKFRGANVKNILSFEEVFPETKVIKLEQNYRSVQNILDAANVLIRHNKGRKEKSLWSERGAGAKVRYNVYSSASEEAEGIVRDIRRRVEKGGAYNDCAVLYRTNAQSRSLEEKFVELGVPYRIYGGVNFYGRKEIKDILAYLKTIDNARDDLAVRRIINIPKRGIGNSTVEKVTAYADEKECSFFVALAAAEEIGTLSKSTAGKLTNFCTLISALRAKAGELPVRKFIAELLGDIRYEEYLYDEDEPDEAADRLANVEELISKAALYEADAENPTLGGFLEEVALVADIDGMDENNNIVSLMTLHSAKGLEFPTVYLAGMEDGLFPSSMSLDSEDPTDLEEERRLCYVGITRAKDNLVMSMARQRTVRGETHINRPSRFIAEIPEEYRSGDAQSEGKTSAFTYSEADEKNLDAVLPWNRGYTQHVPKAPAPAYASMSKTIPRPAASAAELGYTVGDRVFHVKFGEGTVEKIASGGRDFEVTVIFDTAGIKKMFASFANLAKID